MIQCKSNKSPKPNDIRSLAWAEVFCSGVETDRKFLQVSKGNELDTKYKKHPNLDNFDENEKKISSDSI